uniref:SDR family NAD(P)-dependent oxidoreductase n=1 Tax=Acidobacterium capsulatum TaxID=33075 RepID=A0A7V5CUG7_9BACT
MQISGNTILITGGGSGIGRALAEAFHREGNQVIIAGRRKSVLDETTAANPGMASMVLDIESKEAVKKFAAEIVQKFPKLNVVLNNAGIMQVENFKEAADEATAESIININLLGTIRLTSALLPHLLQQPKATVLTVSSGLAFVPLAMTPAYCATKAAVHSWSQSLRYQLKNTSVGVIEIIPPYVQTELMGAQQATDSRAMPLGEYLQETFHILKTQPDVEEVHVERVKFLTQAAERGEYGKVFETLNGMWAGEGH